MDLEEMAYQIWNLVRLAQDPLSPSRSVRPLVKELEKILEACRDEVACQLQRLRELDERFASMEWGSGNPDRIGVYAVISGKNPPALWVFKYGKWEPIESKSQPKGSFRRARVLLPTATKSEGS